MDRSRFIALPGDTGNFDASGERHRCMGDQQRRTERWQKYWDKHSKSYDRKMGSFDRKLVGRRKRSG